MGEAERRLKANKVIAGKRCGWCRVELSLGEDVAVCGECRLLHHASCWDQNAGCARPDCVNAPLQQVQDPVAAVAGQPPPIRAHCSSCGKPVSRSARSCPFCNEPIRRSVRRRPGRYRERVSKADKPLSAIDWVLCFLCPGIACIIGIVALIQGETKRGGIMIALGFGISILATFLRMAAEGRL